MIKEEMENAKLIRINLVIFGNLYLVFKTNRIKRYVPKTYEISCVPFTSHSRFRFLFDYDMITLSLSFASLSLSLFYIRLVGCILE